MFTMIRRILLQKVNTGSQFNSPKCFSSLPSAKLVNFGRQKQTKLFVPFNHIVTNSLKCNFNISVRCFKTSKPHHALPPIFVLIASRLGKFAAVLFGRGVRKWWHNLPPAEKAKYVAKMRKNRNYIGGISGIAAFSALVYYETHLEEAPITGRKRFVIFTDKQFDEISKVERNMLLEKYRDRILPASTLHPSYRKVVRVATRLLQANNDVKTVNDKEWAITVIHDDNFHNAMVLPCGTIFVFTGILKVCETDDELGVLLAHEMAHSILGHGPERASYGHFVDLLMIVPFALLWALIPSDITAAILSWAVNSVSDILWDLPYSRFIETEADQVGLTLAAKACFDIRYASVFWTKMGAIGGIEHESSLEWLSTHPSHENRKNQVDEMVPEALKTREFSRCPPLPYFDPRAQIASIQKKMQKSKDPYSDLVVHIDPKKP